MYFLAFSIAFTLGLELKDSLHVLDNKSSKPNVRMRRNW